ncbi:MAG: hypothetical protein IJB07_00125, partial [Firmicutes bacterium]|nr:hypothetical protein [Bacillota bacterium]
MEKETVRVHRRDGSDVTITLAEYAGFCFGVGRAIDKTLEAAEVYKESGRKVSTCGSLIHNKIVTDELLEKGVGVIHGPEEAQPGSVVIVRAHGEPKRFYEIASASSLEIIDA